MRVVCPVKTSPLCSPTLEPQRDTTANRSARGTDLRQDLSVIDIRLSVQQVSRVDNRFGVKRQTKGWQILCDLNAQGRIINTKLPSEWIDSENCGIARETKNGSHMCSAAEARAYLKRCCLEEAVLENISGRG